LRNHRHLGLAIEEEAKIVFIITNPLCILQNGFFFIIICKLYKIRGDNMKTFIFLGLLSVFSLFFVYEVQASNVRLIINNQEIGELPSPPVMRNDRVLVPARAVFEQLGGTVGWHSGNRQVSIFHGDDVLIMTIDETAAVLNGQPITMNAAPIILLDTTMVPLRFPAEVFGFEVYWDEETPAAIVNTPGISNNNGENGYIPTPPEILNPKPTPEEPEIYEPITTNPDDTFVPFPPPLTLPPSSSPTSPESEITPPAGRTIARNVSSTPIVADPSPQTNITQVLTPSEVGMGAYVVVTDSPISAVDYFVLSDNRVVVTIRNAVNLVTNGIPLHHTVPVSGVRITQYSTVPMVSRIVFDVEGAADFSLSLSADRQALKIAFTRNNIQNVFTRTENGMDSLVIQGDVLPTISISTEGYPRFLTINIDNATMQNSGNFSFVGNFATNFVTGQRTDGTAYVRLYLGDKWPSYSVAHENNAIVFQLHQALTGIRYDSARRELHISKNQGFSMDIGQIIHTDEYLQLKYSLKLPNSAAELGRGSLSVLDGFINSVTLDTDMGNARLVFDTARVLVFYVYETAESYIIRAYLPTEVSPFVVVIDPGHGGTNIGTAHHGVIERHLVLGISKKVMQLIDANPNIRAYMTRYDDSTVPNTWRAEFANGLDADLFVSVHANAAGTLASPNPEPHGIETLYGFGKREQNSNNTFTSRQFAEIIQQHMITRTNARNRALVYRDATIVLRDTNMPAVLLEVGFLTNPQEAARLATAQYQWQLAYAIYDAIVEASNTFPVRR